MKSVLGFVFAASAFAQELQLVFMGDWGGQPSSPYYTPDEKDTAKIMGEVTGQHSVSAVIGIGDNFYNSGITSENSPRFKETFDDVFTASSLQKMPFWFVAGNHDHYGNVSAEIARNGVGRWNFPDYWYSKTWKVPGTNRTVDIVLFDTILACGGTQDADFCRDNGIPMEECLLHPKGPENAKLAESQWQWVENQLATSTADYLLVAGHYPVWSIAEHGPTQCLISQLRPMLIKYNVTAYLCGHDHTFEYLVETEYPNLGYIVTGSAHVCNPSTSHSKNVPKNSLKFHGCTDGGFTRVKFTNTQLEFYHYYGSGSSVKYSNTLKPRK